MRCKWCGECSMLLSCSSCWERGKERRASLSSEWQEEESRGRALELFLADRTALPPSKGVSLLDDEPPRAGAAQNIVSISRSPNAAPK